MKDIFTISEEDVQNVALKKIGKILNQEELYKVKKGIASGLELWGDIVVYAIEEIFSAKEK